MARRTREIWANLIRQLERSGLSVEEFAARREIPVKTLRWWSWRLRRDAPDEPSLLPVRVVPSTAPLARRDDDATVVEVVLPDGVSLRFSGTAALAAVVEVVSRLRAC